MLLLIFCLIVGSSHANVNPCIEVDKIITAEHSQWKMHYRMGDFYLNKGMVDEAILEYKRALEINPNYADAHNNVAVAYFAKGDINLSWKHVRIAEKLDHSPHPKFIELLKKVSN